MNILDFDTFIKRLREFTPAQLDTQFEDSTGKRFRLGDIIEFYSDERQIATKPGKPDWTRSLDVVERRNSNTDYAYSYDINGGASLCRLDKVATIIGNIYETPELLRELMVFSENPLVRAVALMTLGGGF